LCGELSGGGPDRGAGGCCEGLRYRVQPIEVDAGACTRVKPGQLGPVLMKMDVAVEPAP